MRSRQIGITLIIIKASIGAGVLIFPTISTAFGFLPTMLLCIAVWAIMTYTALLLVEISQWSPTNSHFISILASIWGRHSQWLTWPLLLAFLYAQMIAYLSALGVLGQILTNQSKILYELPFSWILLGILLLIALVVFFRTRAVDYVNRLFILGLIICLILTIYKFFPIMDWQYLLNTNVDGMWLMLPVMVTSLTFHIIIPGLRNYLNDDVVALRRCIVWGTTITLGIYLFWDMIMLGIIPAENGIAANSPTALIVVNTLHYLIDQTWISHITYVFGLLSILSSLLILCWTLCEVVSDGLRFNRIKHPYIVVIMLALLPLFLYVIIFANDPTMALNYLAIFNILLYVVLPISLVWRGRYIRHLAFGYQVRGDKTLLIMAFLLGLMLLWINSL